MNAAGGTYSGWRQGLANYGYKIRRVSVFAVCVNLDVSYWISSIVQVPGHSQQVANLPCPAEDPHVIGGGSIFTAPTAAAARNTAIAATRPFAGGSGWQVWMDNYNFFDSIPMSVRAVCSPPL